MQIQYESAVRSRKSSCRSHTQVTRSTVGILQLAGRARCDREAANVEDELIARVYRYCLASVANSVHVQLYRYPG